MPGSPIGKVAASRAPIDPSCSPFWTALLAAFDAHEVRYCALHAEGPLLSETDFAVHPADRPKLAKAFSDLRKAGYRAVQSFQFAPKCFHFVFAHLEAEETVAVDLKFCIEASNGVLSSERLMITRRRCGVLWVPQAGLIDKLDQELLQQNAWHRKLQSLELFIRNVRSVNHGEGAFLVFLGPDGVGKTTLSNEISAALAPVFSGQHFFRWRPAIFARAPRPSALPHSKPLRSVKGSVSYLVFLWLDFVAGYLFRYRQMLRQGELVVFDRYYHDLLIDPKRYRYNRPLWLARMLRHLVPPRDAFLVVLDADEQTIFTRKQQLALEEIRRQRMVYRQFARVTPLSVLVATDSSLSECKTRALSALFRHLADRTERRNPEWFSSRATPETAAPVAVSTPGSEFSD